MRVLQINSSFEPLAFIPFERAIKLYLNNKVDIISNWNDEFYFGAGKMNYPAVVKMKYYIRKPAGRMRFSRKSVFRRDYFTCQYCGIAQTTAQLTIDHIIPQCNGGLSTWTNCVTSCWQCNAKKGSKSLDEVKMKLLSKPHEPSSLNGLVNEYMFSSPKHDEWDYFFQGLINHGKYLK